MRITPSLTFKHFSAVPKVSLFTAMYPWGSKYVFLNVLFPDAGQPTIITNSWFCNNKENV